MADHITPALTRKPTLSQRSAVAWFFCFGFTFLALNALLLTVHKWSAILLLAYCLWINGPGRRASQNASWPSPLRRWSIYKTMAAYFPCRIHKTQDLDPDSIDMHPLTLGLNFRIPFLREYLLLHGVGDVSRESCLQLLSRKGRAILIAVGGAAESLYAHPGTMELVVHMRKGFVKIALQQGACLVAVIGFGENEVYDTFVLPRNSTAGKLQRFLQSNLGFALPLFWGTGFFGGLGLLPKPVPLTTVVGKPIQARPIPSVCLQVERWDAGTDVNKSDAKDLNSAVEKYHQLYLEQLQALYTQYQPMFAPGSAKQMSFVE